MSCSGSFPSLGNANDYLNQGSEQLAGILRKKILWNKAFREVSDAEGELYRRLREFMSKETEYMNLVNDLLDSILFSDLDLSLYKVIEEKYNVVDQYVRKFKLKLNRTTQEVEKARMEWFDGFLPNQLRFTGFSAEQKKAVVKRCGEGDRITERAKQLLQDLTDEWNALEADLEERLKDCAQKVKFLLLPLDQFGFKSINWNCRSVSEAGSEVVTNTLSKGALEAIIKKPVPIKRI